MTFIYTYIYIYTYTYIYIYIYIYILLSCVYIIYIYIYIINIYICYEKRLCDFLSNNIADDFLTCGVIFNVFKVPEIFTATFITLSFGLRTKNIII